MTLKLRPPTLTLLACLTSWSAGSAEIDCKTILCLGGGFPDGCQDAHAYMMDRIRSIPPKPPFGICETVTSDGRASIYHGASGSLGSRETRRHCAAYSERSRGEEGGSCVRECWTEESVVNLTVRTGDPEPFRASHAYASRLQCENISPSGRSADDQQ